MTKMVMKMHNYFCNGVRKTLIVNVQVAVKNMKAYAIWPFFVVLKIIEKLTTWDVEVKKNDFDMILKYKLDSFESFLGGFDNAMDSGAQFLKSEKKTLCDLEFTRCRFKSSRYKITHHEEE